MKIYYDKDFKKVMTELQTNFGWSNIEVLPESYKDLLNDTIKAVKNCSIHDVVGQIEQCEHDYQPCKHQAISEFDKCTECGKII